MGKIKINKSDIESRILDGKSIEDISIDLNVSKGTIARRIVEFDLGRVEKNIENRVGERFGKLVVLSVVYGEKTNGQPRRNRLKCTCDCGNQIIALASNIVSGKTKSCGCGEEANKKIIFAPTTSLIRVGDVSLLYFNRLKTSAKQRELYFGITMEDIWSRYKAQTGTCAISGRPIFFNKICTGSERQTASVDRIDSTEGYYPDNIQIVHTRINKMKSNLPDDIFLGWCVDIANFNCLYRSED